MKLLNEYSANLNEYLAKKINAIFFYRVFLKITLLITYSGEYENLIIIDL